jgi:hypothetical protein
MSEQVIERTLNLTDKTLEDLLSENDASAGSVEKINSAAKMKVDVPKEQSPDGKIYRYTIFVPKTAMAETMMKKDTLEEFWQELTEKVLEDLKNNT